MIHGFRYGMTVIGLSTLLLACDPEGRKQCEWVLEPEPDLKGQTDPNYIPVCARNYKTNKQDCRLQMKLADAKKVHQRKFRYDDLAIKDPGLPRTISSIKFCDGTKEKYL